MSRPSLPFVGAALLVLVIAACSGSSATPTAAPASPAATPAASPSPSESPSTAASSGASESAVPSIELPSGSGALPSFALPHEDPSLEAVLPASINGVQLDKGSFKGASFLQGAGNNAQQYQQFLGALGKSVNDVSFAIAFDMTGKSTASIGAFRVAGADQGALMAAFVNATKQSSASAQVSQANVGGKDVTKIVDSSNSQGAQYVYVKGDTLYFAQANDDASAATALQALP